MDGQILDLFLLILSSLPTLFYYCFYAALGHIKSTTIRQYWSTEAVLAHILPDITSYM